ncbi:tpr repeat [Plakobranchus ocellatus]|uniref:Tpr repeat n=1 Tax=Plakobranchus ocellatus TaxID=259542 RepID=A0AAV3ZSJ2_9GAST|nr:tpr repeat [Plakobranchus ocellatus]
MENFPPMANERRRKWKFRSMAEVNQVSNSILRQIMVHERSKRWGKVIEAYQRLLWVIDKKHFPADYEPPASYGILLYELHFHLGLALQRLGLHRKSVLHYTKAIEAVSIPKGGCLAGCMTNSCLMTPLYSRRAFAYTQVGDLVSALRDAESVVVLDNRNADVYCIRALVRASRNEERLALGDLDQALTFAPNHVACLVVRGAITRPLSPKYPGGPPRQNKYLVKAEKLNPESQSYFNVDSFHHPCILDFYDRLLFTLLVPHTVTTIDLTPDKPTKKQIESNLDIHNRSDSARASTPGAGSSPNERPETPFRCGTPSGGDNVLAARRRHDYGEAVRKHNSRPRSAADFMARLEKERQSHYLTTRRAQTTVPPPAASRPVSACPPRDGSENLPSRSVRFATPDATQSSALPGGPGYPNYSGAKKRTRTSSTKAFVFETPDNYTIPVFQPVNIREAPRMYYRPWRGDKLPVAEVPHPQPRPAFY